MVPTGNAIHLSQLDFCHGVTLFLYLLDVIKPLISPSYIIMVSCQFIAIEASEKYLGFSPEPGWSHYRTLMNVENRNETIAKYSVLKESKQIFASKYILQLPTEDELRLEIERERRQIEENHEE